MDWQSRIMKRNNFQIKDTIDSRMSFSNFKTSTFRKIFPPSWLKIVNGGRIRVSETVHHASKKILLIYVFINLIFELVNTKFDSLYCYSVSFLQNYLF